MGVIAAGHVGKLPPALPSIRTQLGLGIVTAGWLASMFSAIGAVAALFLGAIADQLNPWRLAVGGLVLMMVSGFLGSFATATSQLIISRFFEGVGFLAVVVAAPSIIGRATGGVHMLSQDPGSYGKGAIVGLNGEFEHGGACIHSMLGKPMRSSVGGGKAVIPSNVKVAALVSMYH